MRWLSWDELPDSMRVAEVRPYWEALDARRGYLRAKRAFDVLGSSVLLVALSPVIGVLAVAIKLDTPGPALFRQERVTQYGRRFHIHKLRTMVDNAESLGPQVTTGEDARITRVGRVIRRFRMDEFPQLIDILTGNMSFVGTRPEAPRYVEAYEPEWRATLLLPAGVTSEASIAFRDEDELLADVDDADRAYVETILPRKMRLNLHAIRACSMAYDLLVTIKTVAAVAGLGPQGNAAGKEAMSS